ncbi:major capsid protein [Gordonia phage Neville]|uniref:Major capsid protein n=1 Tax=Gordonia phage Neville TaxID=2301693 RepID=A0A385E040_9CAUD|nr:major capsid protein [Gordonia phage Neville]AXQ64388.1 major capsid protein [Gordonia phage Neville]
MTFNAVKVEKLANYSLNLLQRSIILPSTITVKSGEEFRGALGDAITIKIGARTKAKRTLIRPATENDRNIEFSDMSEQKTHVYLKHRIYNAQALEDEKAKLDVEDVFSQIVAPQVRSVAIDFENLIAEEISGAPYKFVVDVDPDKTYHAFVEANRLLGQAFIPDDGRTLLVGANFEAALRLSPQFIAASSAGDTIASSLLARASLGTINGYNVVKSYALPANEAYIIHRSAFSAAWLAPVVPDGASWGKSIGAEGGLSLTWLKDYDFSKGRDRSLVHVYAGTNTTIDEPDENADNEVVAEGGFLRGAKLVLPDPS